MKIKFIENENEPFELDSIILKRDNWNDYGYFDYFNVMYVPSKSSVPLIPIGNYRIICSKDMLTSFGKDSYTAIQRSNKQNNCLNGNFLSLGETTSFYIKLFNVLNEFDHTMEDMKDILNKLNDILLFDQSNLLIENKATLKGIYTDIRQKTTSRVFTEVDKTLFRDGAISIYLLNNILMQHNYSIFYLFERGRLEEILKQLDQNEQFFDMFTDVIMKSTNFVMQPVVENIVSIIESDNILVNISKKVLEVFRNKYGVDEKLNRRINKLLGDFGDVIDLVNQIKQALVVSENEIDNFTIGHYTNLTTIQNLIKSKDETERPYLRLTNINQLNDPLEGKSIFNFLSLKSTHNTQNYVSCATIATDSLPMWNLYADNAKGIFLIYDKKYLNEIIHSKNQISLYHVCYLHFNDKYNIDDILIPSSINSEDLGKKIRGILEALQVKIKNLNIEELEESDKNNLYQIIEDISFLFKNMEYSYEKELRFNINSPKEIKLQPKKDYPFPFLYTSFEEIELQYSKVILGPRTEIERDYIAPYIGYISDNRITVDKSKAHIRN